MAGYSAKQKQLLECHQFVALWNLSPHLKSSLSLALLGHGRCPCLSGKPNQTFLNVVCLPFYLDFSQIHAFIPWIELSFHSEIRSEKKYLQWVAQNTFRANQDVVFFLFFFFLNIALAVFWIKFNTFYTTLQQHHQSKLKSYMY